MVIVKLNWGSRFTNKLEPVSDNEELDFTEETNNDSYHCLFFQYRNNTCYRIFSLHS